MSHRPWGEKAQERARRVLKRAVARANAASPCPREYLLPLRAGEEVSLSGIVEVRAVSGCAEVWGALLQPSLLFERVLVPPWGALPRLRALRAIAASARPSEKDGEASSQDGDASSLDLSDTAAGAAAPTAAPPAPLEEEADDVRAYLAQHAWPTVLCVRLPGLPATASASQGEAALAAALLAPLARHRLRAHKAWPSLADNFGGAALGGPARSRVLLVMGPKGVGKSTCCRYFVNKLLSAQGLGPRGHASVCLLETDIGQPELGPPGVVALHRVRRPLLRAPHAEQHSHECLAACFAGGATPGIHPELFVRSVRECFDAYVRLCNACSDELPPPLVVNSHGWLTGLGFELVRVILAITQPQLVVRIQAAASEPGALKRTWAARHETEPGDLKRPRTDLARCGPLAAALEGAAGVRVVDAPGCVLVSLGSAVEAVAVAGGPRSPAAGAPTAPEMRWLRMAGYFRHEEDPCARPSGLPASDFFRRSAPVRLPLRRLRFGIVGGALCESEVEAALTGTLVALCRLGAPAAPAAPAAPGDAANAANAADAADPPGGSRPPSVLRAVGVDAALRCVGLAFVHSFDIAAGEIVLYTPAAPEALAAADALLRGDVTWEPHSVRGQRVAAEAQAGAGVFQPYCAPWALEGMAAGARVLSQRRNVRRTRHAGGPGG